MTAPTVEVEVVGGPDDGRVLDVPVDQQGRPPARLGTPGLNLEVEFGPGVHLDLSPPTPASGPGVPQYDVEPSGRTDGIAWVARYRSS